MMAILLPLDGSSLAEQALPYAAALAQRTAARLILVRAVQAHTILDVGAGEAQAGVVSRAEHALEATAARLREAGIAAEAHVYYDRAAPAILDAARRHHADLIVMSTHGRSGIGRVVYGSVADDVLRNAEVPVLLVPAVVDRAWPADRPLTILVSLDGSALAEEALGSAELLAETLGARLHLLRIVEPPTYPLYGDGYVYIPVDQDAEQEDARAYLTELANRLATQGKTVETEVAVGAPGTVVAAIAAERQADVIAMATHGRSGLARLVLGSVATGTLQRAHVPLLMTRPAALERVEPPPPPQPEQVAPAEDRSIALTLSPAELQVARRAVESMLVDSDHEEHAAARLRLILGKLRTAEQSGAASVETEAPGPISTR